MITFPDMIRTFGRIGILSFGGPAAQIGLLQQVLVDEKRWLTEQEFLRALSFCMLLPGPEAMQMATWCGWRLRGTLGGIIAGGLFVVPGAALILALALAYIEFGDLPLVQAAFLGVQACVTVVVFQALRKLSRRALAGPLDYWVAGLSFLALYLFAIPFPVVLLCAAAFGAIGAKPESHTETMGGTMSLRPLWVWGGLWLTPIVAAWATAQDFLLEVMIYFSKLAVVTFGGAYAVIAYMAQEIVTTKGWLSADQMMDALGLAETTPGPLILVTQFVGTLAGQAVGGTSLAILAFFAALWVTFIPCFLWIFLFAPVLERVMAAPKLAGALRMVTAAVVGVIGSLAAWFAINVMFGANQDVVLGPINVLVPVWTSLNGLAVFWTGFAAIALTRVPLPLVLVLCAALSAAVISLGPALLTG